MNVLTSPEALASKEGAYAMDVLSFIANHTRGLVSITLHPVETMDEEAAWVMGKEGSEAIPRGMWKPCATQRLKLPFIPSMAGVPKLIYVDADSVATCDLELLWDCFESFGRSTWAGVVEEAAHEKYSTMYRPLPGTKLPTFSESGFNSGVMLMNLDRLRPLGLEYWRLLKNATATGGFAPYGVPGPIFGDQDLLNLVSAQRPEWFTTLDRRWNWRWSTGEPVQAHIMNDGGPPLREPFVPGLHPGCIEHFAGSSGHGEIARNGRHLLFLYNKYWRLLS